MLAMFSPSTALLSPWLVLFTVRDLVLSFQNTFTPAYIMTRGGPNYSTFFFIADLRNCLRRNAFWSCRCFDVVRAALHLITGSACLFPLRSLGVDEE
jgi:ABC-type sugar transport system permease subunit